MKVGFIGVGNMGGPMCRNIIRNTNHEVVVFDLNPAAIKACTDLGAAAGSSVAQIAAGCDVVFTSLPMPGRKWRSALTASRRMPSRHGLHRSLHQFARHRAAGARRHAGERHRHAGVAGLRRHGARKGRHDRHHGGRRSGGVREQLPLLKSFSGEVVHVGEIGMGSVAKLVNNMLAFCNAAAAAEALMIGAMQASTCTSCSR